jgi:hypothetical protein
MLCESVLLSTACCPPVFYFAQMLTHKKVFIEQWEHFIKQTYRNRYSILSPNGRVDLIVPVEHGRKPGLKIRDVRIAWHTEWQRNHWRTICAAYNNSPWFRDMEEEIKPYYTAKWEFLFDYNQEFMHTILGLLKINANFLFTEGFESVPGSFDNFRELISPKTDASQWDSGYIQPTYTQVFSEKFPFIPGLSILDLLFNEGPAAREKLLLTSFLPY